MLVLRPQCLMLPPCCQMPFFGQMLGLSTFLPLYKTSTIMQASSAGESLSTLAFGARVSEITLGRATRNCESSAVFEAHQAAQQCAPLK